jgi:hypothetical protein
MKHNGDDESYEKGLCSEGEMLQGAVGKSHNSFVHVEIFHVENFLDYFGCFLNDIATVGLNS